MWNHSSHIQPHHCTCKMFQHCISAQTRISSLRAKAAGYELWVSPAAVIILCGVETSLLLYRSTLDIEPTRTIFCENSLFWVLVPLIYYKPSPIPIRLCAVLHCSKKITFPSHVPFFYHVTSLTIVEAWTFRYEDWTLYLFVRLSIQVCRSTSNLWKTDTVTEQSGSHQLVPSSLHSTSKIWQLSVSSMLRRITNNTNHLKSIAVLFLACSNFIQLIE